MSQAIRVLLADDHSIVREGIALVLETADDIEVVGEASNGREATEMTSDLSPDVVLMDLRMPEVDGLSALQAISADTPDVAVVILTTFNEDEMMLRALQLGARGYLLKDTDRDALLRTIRAAAAGETLLQPEIVEGALGRAGGSDARVRGADTAEHGLTDREIEVLRAVATGDRNKEIAHTLHISERTVKAHLSSAYRKLGVDSRAGAVAEAASMGLLDGEQR